MVFSRKPRSTVESVLTIDKDDVKITDSLKYLGVILDRKLTFTPHFDYAIAKTSKITGALTGLMPNLRGPCESKRKLFSNVTLSVLLYGAPVWSSYLYKNRRMLNKMDQSLKLICNRVICAYRTVSLEAATLLARILPVSLQADYRRRVYERVRDLHRLGEYSPRNAAEIKKEENLLMTMVN